MRHLRHSIEICKFCAFQKGSMEIKNTTLDDVASVIGFSATLRLAAWFGDGVGNLYVPTTVGPDQLLVRLIGESAARRMSESWGGEHVAVPQISEYEIGVKRRAIAKLFERKFTSREIALIMGISERRVQQICRELEQAGLMDVVVPEKKTRVVAGRKITHNLWGEIPQEIAPESPQESPQENGGENA